jgi:alkylhydroperoxidase/carboxymuconolactone decarboxylase family protein YurZ
MQELTSILSEAELAALRAAYDPTTLLNANKSALARVYPRLLPWQTMVGSVFFQDSPLAPRDRELALITLLAHRSPDVALSDHIYWGLMEGVSVLEVCEVVGLTGQYCGMPTYTQAILTVFRTLTVLKRLATSADPGTAAVHDALIREFVGVELRQAER